MYLKRLDIQGFKSFPEKVRLEFNKGITAVVGPNGSGKSNVSDAVRWVLGEQKVKSLRGDKMEDIIFSGTETRKPLGFAEVSMTIDNQDAKMPIAYTEVTVTRRVFRSGESEYLLNGMGCRLKDIHELFMDTGVGREGYSIIGQGKIDEILSAKSDDRRRLFEEAAGIVKYKNRRNEAVSKLEKEKQNLLRVEDIITELESQIAPLKQQSETAKEYIDKKEKLKYIEIALFKTEADRLEKELEKLEENHQIILKNQMEEENTETELQNKNAALKQESDALTEEIDLANKNLAKLSAEIENKEGGIRLAEEQSQHIQMEMSRLESEGENKKEKLQQNRSQIMLYHTKLSAVEIRQTAEDKKLQCVEKDFSILNERLGKDEAYIEENKADLIEKIKYNMELKGDISKKESILEQFHQRGKQIENEKEYLSSQMHNQKIHTTALDKQIEENENAKMEAQKIRTITEAEKNNVQSEKEMAQQNLRQKEKLFHEKKSRYTVLLELEQEHEGFFKSVKSILKLKSQPKWQGIHGAVGELITVEKKYETAIEIALGSSVQNIITETEEDAKNAIQYLKNNHLGRATFLPVSAVKQKELGNEKNNFIGEKGFIGIGVDLVLYDFKYYNIISSLLGKVIVMEDINSAIALAKKYRHSFRIVTLEGDILNPGGSMTGGSISKKSSNIFGRSREIKELKQYLQNEKTEIDITRNLIGEKNIQLEKLEYTITEKLMEVQKLELHIASSKQENERIEESIKGQKEKFRLYELESKQLKEQFEHIEKDIIIKKEQLLQSENELKTLNEKLSVYQGAMETEKTQRENLLRQITEIKIQLSHYEQNKQSIQENIGRVESENETIQKEMLELEKQKEQNKIQHRRKMEEIVLLKENVRQYQNNQLESQRTLVGFSEKRRAITTVLNTLEEKIKHSLTIISQLKNDGFRIETKKETVLQEKQRIYNEIWEEYEITYQQALELNHLEISYNQLKKEAKELKTLIKALGTVNVDAIEKYKEVKERYQFLTEQKDDIINAEIKLKEIIITLSGLMEKQFKEQFLVISNNFNSVFQEMFGGGKAYLKLADDSNILESPIEIIAQPPGKTLQNMMLLSGGERALTAIAILFSILKMKPSPFCILDEIEAALDDANVKRYANYLTKFSKDTQFIVITHRKGTMESADVLYGITMQEKGVSKLVSVDFEQTKYA